MTLAQELAQICVEKRAGISDRGLFALGGAGLGAVSGALGAHHGAHEGSKGRAAVLGGLGGGLLGGAVGDNAGWLFTHEKSPILKALATLSLGFPALNAYPTAEWTAQKLTQPETKTADAPDLKGMRDEFEHSALQEQVLRNHAQRLEELAAQRAAREDTSPTGYAETFAKRLAPIPHTGGEAAIRLPAMIAGGVAGARFGKGFEGMDPAGLERVFSPLDPDKINPVVQRFEDLRSGPLHSEALLKDMRTMPGEEIADAFKERHLPFSGGRGKALRGRLVNTVGEQNMGRLRSAIGNLVRQTAPKDGVAAKGFSKFRVGGAIGGALAGGALAGLPFAIRALLQKRKGGEAAVRARNQSSNALQKAEGESQHREDILNKLPAKSAASLSEMVEILKPSMAAGAAAGGVGGAFLPADSLQERAKHALRGAALTGAGAGLLGGGGLSLMSLRPPGKALQAGSYV